MSASCSLPSASKTTISSIQFRELRRNCSRIPSAERMFEVLDQDGVAEVDGTALAVGEAAVLEHLQEHVEHLSVRLLDLVEQDDRVRTAAHGLRQLAALVVADVPGRRPDQARHRVPLWYSLMSI